MNEGIISLKDHFTLTSDTELKIKRIRGNLRFVKGNVKVVAFARNKSRDIPLQVPFKFGQTLTQMGKSAVVMNLDPKHNDTNVHIDYQPRNLIKYIHGKTDEASIIYHTDINNLDYIPRGEWKKDESYLPAMEKITKLINRLKIYYDFILLNVPALDNMLYAPLALSMCDSAVILLEEEQSSKQTQAYWKRYVELACVTYLGYIEEK